MTEHPTPKERNGHGDLAMGIFWLRTADGWRDAKLSECAAEISRLRAEVARLRGELARVLS